METTEVLQLESNAVNPGPIDGSVLYDQDKHVSSVVWDGQVLLFSGISFVNFPLFKPCRSFDCMFHEITKEKIAYIFYVDYNIDEESTKSYCRSVEHLDVTSTHQSSISGDSHQNRSS